MSKTVQYGNPATTPRRPAHPRQIAWERRRREPVAGMKRRRGGVGCYGVCCGEGTRGGQLCTVCHRYTSHTQVCCGYKTVRVNARIRVPRVGAKGRWKLFLKRFPRFRFREELRYVPEAEVKEEPGTPLGAPDLVGDN